MTTSAREITVALPELHPAQRQVIAEARRFNVLQCGRRFGKTTLGVDRAIDTALDGKPAGWFAPTYKLLGEAFRALVRLTRDIATDINKQEKSITLMTGGRIDCWSMDNADAGRGAKYARVVIDEAGIVRDLQEAWQASIRPTLTDYEGDAWFFGTPKGRNFFHQLYLKGQSQERSWRSWRFATLANPFLAVDEIASARADLPDVVFRQEYEGEPADDGGNPFGIDAIRACIDLPSGGVPVVWGVDLAKSEDWTVAYPLDAEGRTCRAITSALRWQGPWERTLTSLASLIGNMPALVDSTGVGDPVLEALQKRCPKAEGFNFSARSKQQIMEGLAVALHQKAITIPAGVVVQELESFEYEYTRTGVRYSAPSGLHDDCVCALALAVHKAAHKTLPRNFAFPVIQR